MWPSYATECYSAIKRQEVLVLCGWTQEHQAKGKKPDARDHTLYDCIYLKYSEKANLQVQEAVAVAWGQQGLTKDLRELIAEMTMFRN